jgi:F420-dependent oxidoreductase-like protein
VKIGTSLSSGTNFAKMIDEVCELEVAGVEIVWLGESYGYDAVSALGAIAGRTELIEIATGILPIYSRTPALLAMTAAGLDAISGGRFTLGLGVSGPDVIEGWHGVPFEAPIQRTAEIIDTCRRIWTRERIDHRGRGHDDQRGLKLMHELIRPAIPIFVASLGGQNVEMTAAIADGWMPAFFWPEKSAELWGERLAAGRVRRDGSLAPLEIATTAPFWIGDDIERPRGTFARTVAHYIGAMGPPGKNYYFDLAARYGYADVATRIQAMYAGGDTAAAVSAVPTELLEHLSLIGTSDHISSRLRAYAAAGVTVMNVVSLAPTAEARLGQYAELKALVAGLEPEPGADARPLTARCPVPPQGSSAVEGG